MQMFIHEPSFCWADSGARPFERNVAWFVNVLMKTRALQTKQMHGGLPSTKQLFLQRCRTLHSALDSLSEARYDLVLVTWCIQPLSTRTGESCGLKPSSQMQLCAGQGLGASTSVTLFSRGKFSAVYPALLDISFTWRKHGERTAGGQYGI